MNELNKLLDESNFPNEAKTVIKIGSILGFDPILSAMNIINQDLTKKAKNTDMPMHKGMSETEIIIHNMMKESTGINMMDSGGDNGRSWQINQKVFDFRYQDDIKYSVENDYLIVEKNIFHFLTNCLEYDQGLTDIFNDHKDKDESDYSNMSDIADILNDHYNDLNFDEFHEFKLKNDFNTYNYESILSQVLQGQFFTEYEDSQYEENYIILQIHNGADVRGGYTDCKVFKVDLDSWYNENSFGLNCDCLDFENEGSFSTERISEKWKIIKKSRKKYADKIYYCKDCKKRIQITQY